MQSDIKKKIMYLVNNEIRNGNWTNFTTEPGFARAVKNLFGTRTLLLSLVVRLHEIYDSRYVYNVEDFARFCENVRGGYLAAYLSSPTIVATPVSIHTYLLSYTSRIKKPNHSGDQADVPARDGNSI
jgi:hypothetical protein